MCLLESDLEMNARYLKHFEYLWVFSACFAWRSFYVSKEVLLGVHASFLVLPDVFLGRVWKQGGLRKIHQLDLESDLEINAKYCNTLMPWVLVLGFLGEVCNVSKEELLGVPACFLVFPDVFWVEFENRGVWEKTTSPPWKWPWN